MTGSVDVKARARLGLVVSARRHGCQPLPSARQLLSAFSNTGVPRSAIVCLFVSPPTSGDAARRVPAFGVHTSVPAFLNRAARAVVSFFLPVFFFYFLFCVWRRGPSNRNLGVTFLSCFLKSYYVVGTLTACVRRSTLFSHGDGCCLRLVFLVTCFRSAYTARRLSVILHRQWRVSGIIPRRFFLVAAIRNSAQEITFTFGLLRI